MTTRGFPQSRQRARVIHGTFFTADYLRSVPDEEQAGVLAGHHKAVVQVAIYYKAIAEACEGKRDN